MTTINYVTTRDLKTLADQLNRIKNKRKEISILDAKLKTAEEQIGQAILETMIADGQQNVTFEGIGRLVVKKAERIQVKDTTRFKHFVLNRLREELQSGADIINADALALYQQTPHQGNIKSLIESGISEDVIGVESVIKQSLSFTTEKPKE